MSFEKDLLGVSSQEAVIHLQEAEISLLEMVKSCLVARVESDKTYAKALKHVASRAEKYENALKTPLLECWKTVMEKTSEMASLIQTQTDLIQSSSVLKLTQLIADRKLAKSLFVDEKLKQEQEFQTAKTCINRNYGEYTKAMTKVKQKKAEYDDLFQKGKNSAKIEDSKRKYSVLTDKLHRIHNDYVLSMREGRDVQDSLLTRLSPMYMAAQQEYCQDTISHCKSILTEYIGYSESTHVESQTIHSKMKETISALIPKQEYTDFISQTKSDPRFDQLDFDERLLQGYDGPLHADTLTVDETTYGVLTQLSSVYQQQITNCDPNIQSYQEQVKTACNELQKLSPESKKKEGLPKKRHAKFLERKLEHAKLCKQRYETLQKVIDDSLKDLDPSNLPSSVNLDSDAHSDRSGSLTSEQLNGDPNALKPSASSQSIKSKFGRLKQKLMSGGGDESPHMSRDGKRPGQRDEYCVVIPGASSKFVRMTSNPDLPLEDEDWFHGILPRDEVQRLLKVDGDYLVRESKKRSTNESQYVLSVMWQGPKHFIIQTSADSGWRLEGSSYPTIQQLIISQHNSGTAVTNKSQAILSQPIMRETWQVKNDDVHLESKIGNGNFGEVYRGTYNDSVVAVKTCKEELSEDQKKKFIVEGRILRQYDHPNIVKFVGIAAQRNPVMIVMEYVSGGALLSWLRKFGTAEPKRSLIQMCLDAAKGMEYLENKQVIHRDLAARNCLISESMKTVKISDFGMSREEEEYVVTSGMRQIPIKWTAPEALNYGKYTSLCDVWSFGVLMWEVFSGGKTPYPGMKNQDARDRVDSGYRMSSPDDCPTAVYSLMRDCWEENPDKRPHFDRIVKELNAALQESR